LNHGRFLVFIEWDKNTKGKGDLLAKTQGTQSGGSILMKFEFLVETRFIASPGKHLNTEERRVYHRKHRAGEYFLIKYDFLVETGLRPVSAIRIFP